MAQPSENFVCESCEHVQGDPTISVEECDWCPPRYECEKCEYLFCIQQMCMECYVCYECHDGTAHDENPK